MTSQQQVVIGIDVGTTAVKAMAFGFGGARSPMAERRIATANPCPERAEQNPAELRKAVLQALAECVRSVGAAPVRALSLSTAMHGLVGLDAAGEPSTPLVTWADWRASEIVAGWRSDPRAEPLTARTGWARYRPSR